jgi:glycosyltransferase domain-containing protein
MARGTIVIPALTAVIPTRNRSHYLPGQLRLLECARHAVIVADSSDPPHAERVRQACERHVRYQAHPPSLLLYDKLERVMKSVDTPLVLLLSDRKISFPHAIESLASALARPAYVGAQGYILGATIDGHTVDVNRVIWFTPDIAEKNPLWRHYHLMQRYQSWQFGLFRTAPVRRAIAFARTVKGPVFQEIAFMNAMVLQGSFARVRTILTVQGEERSFHPPHRNDPFSWVLKECGSFFFHYRAYRRALVDFIRELAIPVPEGSDLEQIVDLVHAIWLHRNFNDGAANYTVQRLLGENLLPLHLAARRPAWTEPSEVDIVRTGKQRRYVWRRAVLEAEPRTEIGISRAEIDAVTQQLETFFSVRAG